VTDTENEITADLLAELLHEQHPDLADLPLTFGARGWDNQLWRLGDHLAVRLPWATQGADELLLKEHALLPAIAPRLPLPIPVPQRLGQPSERFPRTWIVTTWVTGEPLRVSFHLPSTHLDTQLVLLVTAVARPRGSLP
jgi:aminoglycoside phosphotransferase (APT) family kinase protein